MTLEVLKDTSSLQSQMREFILAGQGIILVKENGRVTHIDIYRVTDWLFLTDGKSLRNIDVVISLLLHEEVIKSSC